MIRASIHIENPKGLLEVYEKLSSIDKNIFRVIRIKNKLQTEHSHVSINFIYGNEIIGELQLKHGHEHICYSGNHFLYELSRADTVGQMR